MQRLPILALILVSAFWGIHAVVGQAVEGQLGAFSLVVIRFTLGSLFFLVLLPKLIRLPMQLLWRLAVVGLFWAVLYPFFFYESLHTITPVEGLLLMNTAPIITTIGGWLIMRERIHWAQRVGILSAFIGIGCNTLGKWQAGPSSVGVMLGIAAAFSFAVYTLSSQRLSHQLRLLEMVGGASIFGALELWAITILSGRTLNVLASVRHLNLVGWGELLYVVTIVSTSAYVLYGYGLKTTSSAVSSALALYPQIIFAAIVQWIWQHTAPTRIEILSALLILGGVVIIQFPFRKDCPFCPVITQRKCQS